MKLFLMWLLGVPVAVTSMVVVQSMMESQRILDSISVGEATGQPGAARVPSPASREASHTPVRN